MSSPSTATRTTRDHVVLCVKLGGARVVFSRCKSRTDADQLAERLRAVGCACEVDTARPSDIAGITRRS